MVEKLNAKTWIDCGLVRVGYWAGHLIQTEAGEQVCFV